MKISHNKGLRISAVIVKRIILVRKSDFVNKGFRGKAQCKNVILIERILVVNKPNSEENGLRDIEASLGINISIWATAHVPLA